MSEDFNSEKFQQYKKEKLSIAEGNYYQAVLYYTQLRELFMKSFNESISLAQENVKAETFLEAITNGVQTSTTYNEQMVTIKNTVEEKVSEAIGAGGNLTSFVPDFINALSKTAERNKKRSSDVKNYLKSASNAIDRVLDQAGLLKTIREQAINLLKEQQGASMGNSLTGAFAFYKRVLMNELLNSSRGASVNISTEWRERILNDAAVQGYASLIGGYFREALTVDAINDYAQKKGSYYSAYQTAKISPSNIHYDVIVGAKPSGLNETEIFSSLQTTLNNMNALTGDGSAILDSVDLENMIIPYYGIQAKSWYAPDDLLAKGRSLRSQWFAIGNREQMLSTFSALNQSSYSWDRGWHNSVALVSHKIPEILGQYQVAYSLPSGLVWTSDLIMQMHQNKLWLSFYYTRKNGKFTYPATQEVAWQPQLYLYSIRNKPKELTKK